MKKTKLLVLAAAMAAMLNVQPASAIDYINFNYTLTPGEGVAQEADSYLKAYFTDIPGGVHLKVDSGGLFDLGFVSRLWFNYDGDAAGLTLGNLSGAGINALDGFVTGDNNLPSTTPGVSGPFDIGIHFLTGAGINADRFDAGETFEADIFGSGVYAVNFLVANIKNYYGRANITEERATDTTAAVVERALGSLDSASPPINTPDASATVGLLGIALMGLGMIQRRLKQ